MILRTAKFARRNQRMVNDKAMNLKAELPMFAYYSNAPDRPFCPACTHNRSHTVDLKSRYTHTITLCCWFEVEVYSPYFHRSHTVDLKSRYTNTKMTGGTPEVRSVKINLIDFWHLAFDLIDFWHLTFNLIDFWHLTLLIFVIWHLTLLIFDIWNLTLLIFDI